MRRIAALLVALLNMAILPPQTILADDIRGPIVARLEVLPTDGEVTAILGLDEIVLLTRSGDHRFFDGLDVRMAVPESVAEFPGALFVSVITSGSLAEGDGIADINGVQLFTSPLARQTQLVFQVPTRSDAQIEGGATVSGVSPSVTADELPLAITLQSRMKGLPPGLAATELEISLRPIPRAIGSVEMIYLNQDDTTFQAESFRAPEFSVTIDDLPVEVLPEYLLTPGLHRISLVSETYQDQSFTIGVEQARVTKLTVPLLPALATVNYTAPRDSRVYLDGVLLPQAFGDFTAVPGEHTIVVIVGDYTVTRRFSVVEGTEYNLSVTMDVDIEEAK